MLTNSKGRKPYLWAVKRLGVILLTKAVRKHPYRWLRDEEKMRNLSIEQRCDEVKGLGGWLADGMWTLLVVS